nr:MAG TPA: hypothetical protein [Caudoviricetes sp.]
MGTLAQLQLLGRRVHCLRQRDRVQLRLLRQLWPRAGFRHW